MAADRGADRRGAVGCDAALERERLRALAADDGEAATGRRVLEVEVVQQRGDVDELLVDGRAVERRERETEEIRPVRVLDYVRGEFVARPLLGFARELRVGPAQRVEVDAAVAAQARRDAQAPHGVRRDDARERREQQAALAGGERAARRARPFPVDARRQPLRPALTVADERYDPRTR